MRTPTLLAIALAPVLGACSSCAEDARPDAAPPPPPALSASALELANGLDVELVTGPCGERGAVVILYEVGADHDPPGRSGMARVVERTLAAPDRMVTGGTDHVIDATSASAGALLEAIDATATRIAIPDGFEGALQRAKTDVLADIADRHGGDAARTAASFAAESVAASRGGGFRGGIAAEVEAITPDEARAFRAAHFTAGNARLVIVGAVDPAAARARLEALAALPRGTPPAVREPGEARVSGTIVMGDAPSTVAISVRAPAIDDPLHAAFLVHAARLASAGTTAWSTDYDPIAQPEVLFVLGPVQPGERAEMAADRVRGEASAIVGRALAPGDLDRARDRYADWLGEDALSPERCAEDPVRFAIARARRAQLGVAEIPIDRVTQAQLTEAATRFEAAHTAAVLGGGAIR